MKKTILLLLFLSACCREYPKETQDEFMHDCRVGGSTQQQCECLLKSVQRAYSHREYKAMERDLASGIAPPTRYFEMAEDCREVGVH